MGMDPATLAIAGLALSAVGTGAGIMGQMQQAQAAQASANYQSEVAANNALIAKQNADYASKEGEEQAAIKQQQTREKMGMVLASQGSSGVDINSPTSSAVRASTAELGALDAQTIRSNAARKAYGYETTANNYSNAAEADKSQANNDATAGYFNAGSGLLSGAGSAMTNYSNVMGKASGIDSINMSDIMMETP